MIVLLGVGGAHYFARALAVYLDFKGGVALDAPTVRIAGREVSTLDRPSLQVSSGALLGERAPVHVLTRLPIPDQCGFWALNPPRHGARCLA